MFIFDYLVVSYSKYISAAFPRVRFQRPPPLVVAVEGLSPIPLTVRPDHAERCELIIFRLIYEILRKEYPLPSSNYTFAASSELILLAQDWTRISLSDANVSSDNAILYSTVLGRELAAELH